MGLYLKRLAVKVGGVFAAALLALAAAAQPFNILDFDWGTSLAVSASAAFLALLDGIVGRFTGDTDDPGVLR